MNNPRPKLLDLFSGAGGCAKGYQRAGFHVTGVDIKPQPRYCGEVFHQGDALEYCREHWREFDAIHASPPCQIHTKLKSMKNAGRHLDMIPETRALLQSTGLPYVIENVQGAPLRACIMLCGSMFGLATECGAGLERHRYFETNWFVGFTPECDHSRSPRTIGVFGSHPRDSAMERRKEFAGSTFSVEDARKAMGIDWMVMKELAQAIPPAYTEWIGNHLMAHLLEARAA